MKVVTFFLSCLILILLNSCKNQASHNSDKKEINDSISILPDAIQETNVHISKQLYDKLFSIINANDSGDLSDSEFKPQADLIKHKIDSIQLLLNSTEKQIVKDYGNQLLDELIQKKASRDN